MNPKRHIFIICLILVLILFLFLPKFLRAPEEAVNSLNTPVNESADKTQATIAINKDENFVFPISNALERVTKKSFGTYVTPENSPVQPERFTGFHTGVDFETFPSEQNTDVSISAICDGKLILKKQATGYGGVAVESCFLNNKPVTVIYGHLRLSSIKAETGQSLKARDFLGFLGREYSSETDGERKHLHLGIHLGGSVNILGYVQNKNDLKDWVDPLVYLK